MYDEKSQYGVVYEENGRYYYHCKYCSYSCHGSNEYVIDVKADYHEEDCELSPKNK